MMSHPILYTGLESQAFLETIGQGRTLLHLEKNQRVFTQGDPADSVYFIQRGTVKITIVSSEGKEGVIALLGSKTFFGEGTLAGQRLRTASAIALSGATLMRINREALIRIFRTNPTFSKLFVDHLIARKARIEADLADQRCNSTEKRLARALLLLADFGRGESQESTIQAISQETLAAVIGTSRSRVNVFMNRFRQQGFIHYDRGIHIHKSLFDVVLGG